MRLIDADALLQRAVPHGWSTPLWVSDIMIEDAPTIEAEPVRHGHWEKIGTIENTWVVHKCSYCGYQTIDNGQYCTNCGAKMDEVEE